ncbi:MAG: class I SAM-dependent methyltransferase [Synechococcaceae cyanobacterium]|nr:class I SAM-dependent methyltransferase [Synechococcaceae cyanobacterium]
MATSLHLPGRRASRTVDPDGGAHLAELLLEQDIHLLSRSEAGRALPWDIVCEEGRRDDVARGFLGWKSLGLGDAYVRGWWRCERIDLLFERLLRLNHGQRRNPIFFRIPASPRLVLDQLRYRLLNLSLLREMDVARQHYDLPAELYEGFLGATMKYTAGDWQGLEPTAGNLDAAQRQNLDHWVRELGISDGDVVLDCGCGWGTLADHLADRFDLTYIGITISAVQLDYCRARHASRNKYFFHHHSYHQRYKELLAACGQEEITSCIFLETIEHGGTRNWPAILRNVREVMAPDGLLGIQVIGSDHPIPVSDPYINKYIFPHLSIGSPSQIGKAIESDRQFVMLSQKNFSANYPPTLRAWNEIFHANWPAIEPFIGRILERTPFATTEQWRRHWEFYLLMCAGAFSAGTYCQDYQVTARPNHYVAA